MINKTIPVLVFLALWASPVYAYLDPSSGSALISALVAGAAGFIYACKSLFYRFFGKSIEEPSSEHEYGIVIFNEGKIYWGTFRLIVEELIRKKVHFRYLTLDLFDPGLEIENPYMDSQLLRKNRSGYTFIERINAPVMISTTPNIGTFGYPLKRPQNVDNLIHVFHSVADISVYKKMSLDSYDCVILAGEFQAKSIREIEKKRSLPQKELVVLGLPYLDDLDEKVKAMPPKKKSHKPIILIGSSWGQKGCLQVYGTDFIRPLAKAGYSVLIRPHPQSYISEVDFIAQCQKDLANLPNVKWDNNLSPFNAMRDSNLLISDTSSIRFDYAFLFNKPVITLDIPRLNLAEFEGEDVDECWSNQASKKIGTVVDKSNVDNLNQIVTETLGSNSIENMEVLRDKFVVNWSRSSEKIVAYLLDKIQQQESR